jgi:hypothetical protein
MHAVSSIDFVERLKDNKEVKNHRRRFLPVVIYKLLIVLLSTVFNKTHHAPNIPAFAYDPHSSFL